MGRVNWKRALRLWVWVWGEISKVPVTGVSGCAGGQFGSRSWVPAPRVEPTVWFTNCTASGPRQSPRNTGRLQAPQRKAQGPPVPGTKCGP